MRSSGRELKMSSLSFCTLLMRLKLCNMLYMKDAYTGEPQLKKNSYRFVRSQSSLLGTKLSDIEDYAPLL